MRAVLQIHRALLLAMVASLQLPVSAPQVPETVLRPAAAPGPLDSPLKGWCVYTDAGTIHQRYSMVFRSISWRELEPREGEYRFAEWERKSWEEPAARGKHIVLRVWADYPGRAPGVPDWLREKGVRLTPYSDYGGGLAPDYNHPATIAGLQRLIAAMGRRYDGHARVAFLQMGFLGFWGEWHTYPRTELFATPDTQKRIIDACRRAFPRTMVMARYAGGYAGKQPWLGFFDDLFPEDTDGPEGWEFLPQMRRSGRTENWRRAAVGGEMAPGQAKKWLGGGYPRTVAMLEAAHFSWVGPYSPALEEPTPELLSRSRTLVRRMGYEFSLREIRHPSRIKRDRPFSFQVTGVNQGVAPFYYPWPVELALMDARGRMAERLPLRVDIRAWLPGAFTLRASPRVRTAPGRYTLALGIRDPGTGRPAVAFANDLPRRDGWTVLSSVTVE